MAKARKGAAAEPTRGVRRRHKAKAAAAPAPPAPAAAPAAARAPAAPARAATSTGAAHGLFVAGDVVLLVGEGDFSFSCALVDKMRNSVFVVATVLDTMKGLCTKYPGAKANVQRLKAAGMEVRCGLDCRQLHKVEAFQGTFTKIVFNFPHLGGDGDSIAAHQQLLRDFFASAAACLEPLPRAEVLVTLKAGEPYKDWAVAQMAKVTGLFRLDRVVPFEATRYAGYAHCRTRGAAYAEARGFSDVNAVDGAQTYVFGLRRTLLEGGGV